MIFKKADKKELDMANRVRYHKLIDELKSAADMNEPVLRVMYEGEYKSVCSAEGALRDVLKRETDLPFKVTRRGRRIYLVRTDMNVDI